MAQQGYDDDLLRRWFSADEHDATRLFTEDDIRGISDVLRRGSRETWSRIPRIYSVLRKIGQTNAIEAFVDNGITDVAFPFTKSTLPEALCDHSARLKFLELQHLVYNTEALRLERYAHHGHFRDPSEVPLKRLGDLGKGGFGFVDHVVSTISNREYARKVISRGKTFRKDKQVLQAFVRELDSLKRLSHRHLVSLVGSYTDRKFVAIVMTPVADCNLEILLERSEPGAQPQPFLRSFFGCLASALGYLHDSSIRHKDIKPSNILIKHDQVYLTDFGTCLDWSELGNSITSTAPPTTPRYCAPEVMAYTERSSMSDMWSLGCVFLEMWTVVKQHSLEEMKIHLTSHGSRTKDYHSNIDGSNSWMDLLSQLPGPSCDKTPGEWISSLLQHQSDLRWSVHTLEDRIREATLDPSARFAYVGLCCLDHNDDTSSSDGSYGLDKVEDIHAHAPQILSPSRSRSSASSKSDAHCSKSEQGAGLPRALRRDQVATSMSDSEHLHHSTGLEPIKNDIQSSDHQVSLAGNAPLLGPPADAPETTSNSIHQTIDMAIRRRHQRDSDQKEDLLAPQQDLDGIDGIDLTGRNQAPHLPGKTAPALLADPTCASQLENINTPNLGGDNPQHEKPSDFVVAKTPNTPPSIPPSRGLPTIKHSLSREPIASQPWLNSEAEARKLGEGAGGQAPNSQPNAHAGSVFSTQPPESTLAPWPIPIPRSPDLIQQNSHNHFDPTRSFQPASTGRARGPRPMQDNRTGTFDHPQSMRRDRTTQRVMERFEKQQHDMPTMSSVYGAQKNIIPRVTGGAEQQPQSPHAESGTPATDGFSTAQHILDGKNHDHDQQFNYAERMNTSTQESFPDLELSQRGSSQAPKGTQEPLNQRNDPKQKHKHKSNSSSIFGIPKISRWSKTTASTNPEILLDKHASTRKRPLSHSGSASRTDLGHFGDDEREVRSDDRLQGAPKETPSQKSLLIEYFEDGKNKGKDPSRPSVRVRVRPSSKSRSTSMAEEEHKRNSERPQNIGETPSSTSRGVQELPESSQSNPPQRTQTKPEVVLRRRVARSTLSPPQDASARSASPESGPLSSKADRRSGIVQTRNTASTPSSINNPEMLAKVEDAIRRLILPELNALKAENRKEQERRRNDPSYAGSTPRRKNHSHSRTEASRSTSPRDPTPDGRAAAGLAAAGLTAAALKAHTLQEDRKHGKQYKSDEPTKRRRRRATKAESYNVGATPVIPPPQDDRDVESMLPQIGSFLEPDLDAESKTPLSQRPPQDEEDEVTMKPLPRLPPGVSRDAFRRVQDNYEANYTTALSEDDDGPRSKYAPHAAYERQHNTWLDSDTEHNSPWLPSWLKKT